MNGHREYSAQYALGVLRHAIRIAIRPDLDLGMRWIATQAVCAIRAALVNEKGRLRLAGENRLGRVHAFAFLDSPEGRWYASRHVDVPKTTVATAKDWTSMAADLLASRHLDFLGLVPLPLISALLQRAGKIGHSVPATGIAYVTLPPQTGTAWFHTSPQWRGSLTGMRNLVNRVSGSPVAIHSFAHSYGDVTANCLIRSQRQDENTGLYQITRLLEPTDRMDATYTITEIVDDSGKMSEWVSQVLAKARPIIIREVDCEPYRDIPRQELAEFTAPTAQSLATYGDPAPRHALRPIALCILRCDGPEGQRVLLNVRSPLTDNDDFGKYSFLSSRILAEDVCSACSGALAPTGDVQEEFQALWVSIGKPKPFQLEKDVFVAAARRCVYSATLLDLPGERFVYKGMHVLAREGSDVQLGYAVLTVDLSDEELIAARRAGKAMFEGVDDVLRLVTISEFLHGNLPVNRFSKERRDWLARHCF
jgi:hypothetical protein